MKANMKMSLMVLQFLLQHMQLALAGMFERREQEGVGCLISLGQAEHGNAKPPHKTLLPGKLLIVPPGLHCMHQPLLNSCLQ